MSVTVLGSSIVRTTCGVGDWVVWAVEQQAGVARVEERRGLTEVVVALMPRAPSVTAVMVTLMRSTELLDPEPICSTEAAPPEVPKEPAAPSSKVIPL